MVVLQDTAYPRLSFNVTQDNVQRIYTPAKKERLWLKRQRLTDESTVVCIVLLKCFQRLGHFPNVTDIPPLIASHIRDALTLEADFYTSIAQMHTSSQRWLKTKIREYCQVDKFTLNNRGLRPFHAKSAVKEFFINQ